MNINTIFNAIRLSSIYGSYGPPKQRDRESRRLLKFRFWFLRHEEKQREEIAKLKAEMDAIKHAAHMPNDYQYNLPTWINCRLYVCYIGAEISPYLQELIESGKLRFPDSPAEKENIRLHARIATLERIIEREAEKMMKAGMPKEGINGKDN